MNTEPNTMARPSPAQEADAALVAATMSHLSADAPALTRLDAEQWQNWALGVALTVPAAV